MTRERLTLKRPVSPKRSDESTTPSRKKSKVVYNTKSNGGGSNSARKPKKSQRLDYNKGVVTTCLKYGIEIVEIEAYSDFIGLSKPHIRGWFKSRKNHRYRKVTKQQFYKFITAVSQIKKRKKQLHNESID